MNSARIKEKMDHLYRALQEYGVRASKKFKALIEERPPPEIENLIQERPKRVGYIISTCCPCTKAHLELAEQAIAKLQLDLVLFVIWPFHYIRGFHTAPLDSWVKKNKYLPWEERMDLLEQTLAFHGNPKIRSLKLSQEWYMQSEKMFSAEESMSYFWTGTWFVIRKLQAFFKAASLDTEFFFCCGEDQYNPNIEALTTQAEEKVWKDYCIVQQLALHHVFAVPRHAKKPLPEVPIPEWSRHQIIMGERLSCGDLSASKVREECSFKTLKAACNLGAIAYILRQRWWPTQVIFSDGT